MSFIHVKGLRAGYGKSVVLRDIDLDIDEGESVAVVGKNGAGKSTLLLSFFGGTTISGGSIEVGGAALQKLPAYRAAMQGVTLSPQGRMILPHLTVGENLLLGAASRRKGPWTPDAVYKLFPVLRERRDKMGMELSGGQQQMLAVGRALLGNPRVLLLDEPARRGDGRCRRAGMVLDDELVLAPERAALRVQALNGERRAVVDERAADGERAGVDVDDAELDGVLRQHAAAQGERGCGGSQQFLDHCNPR